MPFIVRGHFYADAALSFVSLICLFWMWYGARRPYPIFAASGHLMLPAVLLCKISVLAMLPSLLLEPECFAIDPRHYLSGSQVFGGLLALGLACAAALLHFRREPQSPAFDRNILYNYFEINAFFLVCCVLSTIFVHQTLYLLRSSYNINDARVWDMPALVASVAACLFALSRPPLLPEWIRRLRRSFSRQTEEYLASLRKWSGLALSLWLSFWFILFCFRPGYAHPLPHLPLLAPLDAVQTLCLLSILLWLRAVRGRERFLREKTWTLAVQALGGSAFVLCTIIAARTVFWHTFGRGAFAWDFFDIWRILLASPVFLFTISLLWGSIAICLILAAIRVFKSRALWYVGTGLLGLTLCKLLLFDLADRETAYRIASFLVLGFLMLVISYFCPLPPKKLPAERALGREQPCP